MLVSPPAGALLGGTVPCGIALSAGLGGEPSGPGVASASGLVRAPGPEGALDGSGRASAPVGSGFAPPSGFGPSSRGAVVGSPDGARLAAPESPAWATRALGPGSLVIAPVAPKTARHETAIRSTPSMTRQPM